MTGRIGILCVAALLGVSCSASQPKVPQQTDVSPLAQSQAPSSAVQHLRALAEQGNAEALYRAPQHAYTRRLLGAIPRGHVPGARQ